VWNQNAESITGYDKREVMGRNLVSNFISRKYRDSVGKVLSDALNGKETANFEFPLFSKSGEQIDVLLNSTTRRNASGDAVGVIGVGQDVTEQKRANDLIWKQAHYDILTGLPNRRMARDRLEETIKKSRRTGLPFALLMLDIDRFKEVNDALGHAQGDLLLVEIGRRITKCVRESDTVSRLGGDEFAIILSDLEQIEKSGHVAQKIIEALAMPFRLGDNTSFVSASMGITLSPNDAVDSDTLRVNADEAMYLAKKSGGNRVCHYTKALRKSNETRRRMLSDLRGALLKKQIKVQYQPIVEIATGKIFKAEALMRWQHPEFGVVEPKRFIPLAEESGLIHELGDWIFQEATREVARWRELFDPKFQVSVNVSPVQFRQNGKSHEPLWIRHLRREDLSGRSLIVEITEGVLVKAEMSVKENLLLLRKAGIQVALDDFGTGYSSLAYLKTFDIDYLKIDQSFVRNMGADTDDQALCEGIIVMAHKLGLKVIAEGVETEKQLSILESFGCDYAQGWLYSKAVTAENLEIILQKQADAALPVSGRALTPTG
jgi:diguanylate cyclase (GGDEF)-like protein/PAS domain S-box-containing protein